MNPVKAEIIVKGKVQKVGYRDHVQEVARSLNIKGYVENLRDGHVKIICEAEEDIIRRFTQLINIKTDIVEVEKIEIIKKEPATGEYDYFDIKYGTTEEEIGERIVAAFKIAVMTRQDIKNMHVDMKEMHQDVKGSITSMHQDLKSMHIDLKLSIDSMHQDMNRHFEEMAKRYDAISAELLKTREELKRAVDTLVELVRKFLEKP